MHLHYCVLMVGDSAATARVQMDLEVVNEAVWTVCGMTVCIVPMKPCRPFSSYCCPIDDGAMPKDVPHATKELSRTGIAMLCGI